MANDELLTDDYVAGLLAKDAKDCSIKYSSLGLEAFARPKSPANKPKPNTRFLRNIIKDTDSHNAALLAKEAAESRARLQNLARHDDREGKASRVGGGDIRRRQLGDITAILEGRPSKRRRTDSKRDSGNSRRVNISSEDEEQERKIHDDRRRSHRSRDDHEEESGRSRSHRSKDDDRDAGEQSRGHKSHRRRHRSPSEDREEREDYRQRQHRSSGDRGKDKEERRRRHRSCSRSRSPREHGKNEPRTHAKSSKRKRSKSPEPESSHRSRHGRSPSPPSENRAPKTDDKPKAKPDYDSDPLDEIIGPRPPPVPVVRSRGRGTISHASGIDSRFSATYDPTVDVQLDPDEENDWDQALEALRDRQKWKQQGADRLRAAGFAEEEIEKWERGGEKREEDVRWAKKGEGREWDRGKIFDDDGIVISEPSWGRLKGT